MIKNLQFKYFVYLILLSLPLYLVKFNILEIPTTVLEIEIYVLAIWFLVSALINKTLRENLLDFVKNPFFIFWSIFFVAGIISVLVSPDKRISLGIFKAYFFDAALFFFLFCSIMKTKQEIKNSFHAVIISALALSMVGLVQYSSLPQFLQEGRIRSVFSSPNYLALYITPVYFLSSMFVKKPISKNMFPFLASFCILLAAIFTYSRGAWLGLLLGFVFLYSYLISLKIRFKSAYIILILFLIGFAASFFFIVRGSYSFGLVPANRVNESDNIRKEIWTTSLDIGMQHFLFGIGLGNFQNYFGDYTKNWINYPEYITPNAVTPHNILLNIWLQAGLLGVLGFLGLLGTFFVKCFRGLKKEPLINLILIAAMISILGQGLVDSAIWKNDLMVFFLFLVGSSYIINRKGETHGE